MNWKSLLAVGAAVLGLSSSLHADGFIGLEGSDAVALHGDAAYTGQLFKYLQGASSNKVLVLGGVDVSGYDGGVGVDTFSSLLGVTLANYSAIYIEANGIANNTVLNGYGAAVNSFIQQGGNVVIEDYVGGGYDGVVVGGATTPAGSIVGVGVNGDMSSCSDGEVVNAAGATAGFNKAAWGGGTGVLGCWEHQAYEMSYWSSLGYASLIDSGPDSSTGTVFNFGDGTQVGSGFLELTKTTSTNGNTVPEPGVVGLIGLSLAGVIASRKRLSARSK